MNHFRVSVSVLSDGVFNQETGEFDFSQRMRERIYEIEEKFRSKLLIPMNESTKGKCHIHFSENPERNFDADILVEHDEDYETLKSIIRKRIDPKEVLYFCKKPFPPKPID